MRLLLPPAVPNAPEYYSFVNSNDSSLTVQWLPPKVMSGPFLHYKVRVTRLCEDTSVVNELHSCVKSELASSSMSDCYRLS